MSKKSEVVWRAQFDIVGLSESQIEVLGDRVIEFVEGLQAEIIYDTDLFVEEDWDNPDLMDDEDEDWSLDDLDDDD